MEPFKKPEIKPAIIVRNYNELALAKPITAPPPKSNFSINTKQ